MKPIIGVVGPCAAGKTTLVSLLRQEGYEARHIAQEHSYVADMWRRLVHPDILVYLHVSYAFTLSRRKMNWTQNEYEEQLYRLRHAKQHADLYIETDSLTTEEVYNLVIQFVNQIN